MVYRTDSHFVIGSSHDVCQDYACSGVTSDGVAYAIVSDGCSASHDSDFGARIIVRAVESVIDMIAEGISIGYDGEKITRVVEAIIKQKLVSVKGSLELQLPTFYATLLVAVICNNKLYLYARGDGSVSVKLINKDGSTSHYIHQIKYESSAPYYLAYDINPEIKDIYQREYSGRYLEYVHLINDRQECSSTCIDRDNSYVFNSVRDLGESRVEFVSLSSDGLESYMPVPGNPVMVSVDFIHQALRTTAFKNKSDGFVHRRINRMESEDKKSMIQHTDDISVATIIAVNEESHG